MSDSYTWEKKWLIWSHDRCRWWGPNRHGYTPNRHDAGKYSYLEAIDICAQANKCSDFPRETMVEFWEAEAPPLDLSVKSIYPKTVAEDLVGEQPMQSPIVYAPYIPITTGRIKIKKPKNANKYSKRSTSR